MYVMRWAINRQGSSHRGGPEVGLIVGLILSDGGERKRRYRGRLAGAH